MAHAGEPVPIVVDDVNDARLDVFRDVVETGEKFVHILVLTCNLLVTNIHTANEEVEVFQIVTQVRRLAQTLNRAFSTNQGGQLISEIHIQPYIRFRTASESYTWLAGIKDNTVFPFAGTENDS